MTTLNTTSTKVEVNNILTRLNEGDRMVQISKQGAFVMVLGNTGAGKSTFVQFLLGNNDELLSKPIKKGANEFIIQDNSGRISVNSTINSKTEIPELVIDDLTNTAYYDCPGFSDSRSPAHEIMQTYVVRKVIQSANNIKLLFVVNHSSVRHAIDRQDFMLLLRHATSLIKDIDQYRNSIGLIVSKVENQYASIKGQLVFVSDEEVLNGIVDFIENVKEDLYDRLRSADWRNEKEFYINAIKFISTLTKDNICLFRRPNMPGPVSKIAVMQSGKKRMRTMIDSNLTFAKMIPNNFGFTISEKAKNYVYELVFEIRKSIDEELENLASNIKRHYEVTERNTRDLDQLAMIFKSAAETFNNIANRNWIPSEFVTQIMKASRILSFNIPSTNLKQILNYDKYLTFLNVVADKEDVARSVVWILRAQQLLQYNQDSLEWYTFLQNLYMELSQYKVQQNKILRYTSSNTVKQIYDIAYLKKLNIPGLKLYTRNVDNIHLNETKRSFLQSIVEATIKKPLQISANGQKVIVQGHHVVLSQILHRLSCRFCDIYIFAVDTIFIDVDLNKKGHQGSVSMIALNWEVVGARVIILEGVDAAARPKAESAREKTQRGSNGLTGFPGSPAGNFFGIGQQFIGDGKLTVQASGGKGGPGQEGGNGGPGYDVAKYNNVEKIFCWSLGLVFACPAVVDINRRIKHQGGAGGFGGLGGIGGEGGQIRVYIFNGSENRIIVFAKDGNRGIAGRDGRGESNLNNKFRPSALGFHFGSVKSKPMEYGSIINNYKKFIINDSFRKIKPAYFKNFINKLGENESVNLLYMIQDLIDELQTLENKEFSEAEAYQYLLTNIERFAMSNPLSADSKKVLNYLYTATLSCIYRINRRMNNYMILDVTDYLAVVMDDIRKFKKSGYAKNLNMIYAKYLKHLNGKISEAQQALEDEITPEVKMILSEIDARIEAQIEEINKLEKSIQKEIWRLTEQIEMLKNSLITHKVFECIKLVSLFLTFLGPIGVAVSTLIQETAVVARSLALNDNEPTISSTKITLPVKIKKFLDQFTNIITNKQIKLKGQLTKIEQNFSKHLSDNTASDFKDLLAIVAKSQESLDSEINKGVHSESAVDIKVIQNKLMDDLSQLIQSKNITNTKVLSAVSHAQDIIQVGQLSLDLYATIRNEKDKINMVSVTIQQMQQSLDQLIDFENDILEIITISLTRLLGSVKGLTDGMSSSALNIQEWKIQGSLKELKMQFQMIAQQFKIDNKMTLCLEKLQDAMSVAIALLDHIESNKEQVRFAAYLKDINSNKGQIETMGNHEMKEAVVNLQHRINSNVVISEYEMVVNAIKQCVFPFAHHFLDDYNIPQNLILQNNASDVADIIVNKFETLKSKLETSRLVINKFDKYIHRNIEFRDSQSFYVWRGGVHLESIRDLLDGQQVTLRSNVLNGVQENAVKFNEIGVRFKILESDENVQTDFDQQLRHFDVKMTHGGLAYYRCDHQFYAIISDNQTLSYSSNANGNPPRTNVVYDKIRDHDYMLSPFATWKISLVRIKAGFGNLAPFRNNTIDLYLEGRGQFVSNAANICDDDLEKYYPIDESISEMNEIDLLKQDLEEIALTDDGRQQLPKTRKRRNIVGNNMTSSASRNHKSSLIGNIINWFFQPVKHVANWIPTFKEHNQISNNLNLNMNLVDFDVNSFAIGKLLAENGTTTDSSIAFTNTNIQHNLLFLNLLTHRKCRTKLITGTEIFSYPNDEIANKMAYQAYA